MRYIKINENINNSEVKLTSKVDKLENIKNEINSYLTTLCGNQIGFNYAVGNKGIYFTNSEGELVTDDGYACTTFNELCSNMEAILFTLKNMNCNTSTAPEEKVEMENIPPQEEVHQEPAIEEPVEDEIEDEEPVEDILRFESFNNKS